MEAGAIIFAACMIAWQLIGLRESIDRMADIISIDRIANIIRDRKPHDQ